MATESGTKGLAKGVRAAANSVGSVPDACKNCHGKQGLAILPVCYAPAPRVMFDWLKADDAAQARLKRLDSFFVMTDMAATWYYLRSLPTGYLYILKENKTWDAYVVGTDGMLNRMPVESLPEASDGAELTACKREGHSNIMPRFLTLDPELNPKVWMAFSRHRWTAAVRKRYEDDTESCRAERMREVDVAAAARADIGEGRTVPFGAPISIKTLEGIADYTDAAFLKKFHEFTGHAVLDLGSQREPLAAAMTRVSGGTAGKQGVMLIIQDIVGVAEELNTLRVRATQRYDEWQAGGPAADGANADPLRAWMRQSATHVHYLETWVAQRGTRAGEDTTKFMKQSSEQMHKEGVRLVMCTEAQFKSRYGDSIDKPVKSPSGGLNAYSGARWVPANDPKTGAPLMTSPRKSSYSTDVWYDDTDKPERLGSVVHSDAYWAELAKYHGSHYTQRQLARYRKRLDVDALGNFNKQYAVQDKAWADHITSLDQDYVTFVQSRWPSILLHNDFGKAPKPGKASPLAAINEHMKDALARLYTTEKMFGGGAVTDVSMKMLSDFFEKDPADASNWIAVALLTDFSLIDAATGSGNAPSLYAGILGATQLPSQWWSALKEYRAPAAAAAQNLVLPMQQVAQKSKAKLLKGAAGKGATAVAQQLAEVSAREVVWVRAAALWEFVATTNEHYTVNVRFKIGEYLDALAAGGGTAGAGAFVLEGRQPKDRNAARANSRKASKALNKLKHHPALQGDVTVPLVVEKSAWQKTTGRATMVDVYNIGDAKGVVKLPSDVAEALLQNPTVWKEQRWGSVLNREVGFSGLGVALSTWQFWEAIMNLGKTSGFKFADAVATTISGATGIFGGALELGAYWSQVAGRQAAPVAGSLLAANVNRTLTLRFSAGIAGGAGTFMSAASALVSAGRTSKAGDNQAAAHYFMAAGTLGVSGLSTMGGAFFTWRAALAARAGQQVAVRIMAGTVIRGSAAALIGASATGVGIVLLIAGVAWALYAASLEHDENEKFLDRSFFGKHERKEEGRFGGPPMENKDEWVAHGMSEEMLSLGLLALGLSGEISNWEDNWTSRDTIHATLRLGSWDPSLHEVAYRLEAFPTKPALSGGRTPAGEVILKGSSKKNKPVPDEDNPSVHQISIKSDINDKKYQAVRLVFSLSNIDEDEAMAQGEVWEED